MFSTPFKCHPDRAEKEEVTHVPSVALRQRQIPSRLRKFLCLKPGVSLSHTFLIRNYVEQDERVRKRGRKDVRRNKKKDVQVIDFAKQRMKHRDGIREKCLCVNIKDNEVVAAVIFLLPRGGSQNQQIQGLRVKSMDVILG